MKMKFINIFTNKSLEEHDEKVKYEGVKEGNAKAAEIWKKEFENLIEDKRQEKIKMLKEINTEIINLSNINKLNLKKAEKEKAIDEQIIKTLELIKEYEK